MIDPFRQILAVMEDLFRQIEVRVPPPKEVTYQDGYILRYTEKSVQQAIILKFARYISGLYAVNLLMERGFCQESGSLQRVLDDIEEDILFLAYGLTVGQWTKRHDEFLEYFWSEDEAVGIVARDKIRAYVNRTGNPENPSPGIDASRAIFRGYSGYVHGRAINIIDMCAGQPPRFQLSGMIGNPLYDYHVDDLWNPFYRGLTLAATIAQTFGEQSHFDVIYSKTKTFEQQFTAKIFPVSGLPE